MDKTPLYLVKGFVMASAKMLLLRVPVLGSSVLTLVRAKMFLRSLVPSVTRGVRWLFSSRETTNFTYDLEDTNRSYLASLVADITGLSIAECRAFILEIEEDHELKAHVRSVTARSEWGFMADPVARFGRRVGWYALVRALRPRVVIETGVDKGLGACVLTSALRRNASDGFPGRYFGTDINPKAGYLLCGPYAEYGEVLYGDSIESLKKLDVQVDLFINDSDHSADYEAEEYEVILGKLSERAVILGDNSHWTDKLLRFSEKYGRSFLFFQEKPKNHWYPGAGIGISFKR